MTETIKIRPKVHLQNLLQQANEEIKNFSISMGFVAANHSLDVMTKETLRRLEAGEIAQDDVYFQELLHLGYIEEK